MYLNKLYSDKKSFNSIDFNDKGVSIILGKKTSEKSDKTFNGVGKTLSLRLIDFCLGSSKINELKKIKDWNIKLDFTIKNNKCTISRNTDNQDIIYLNNEEEKVSEFNDIMESNLFNLYNDSSKLSYRTLISRFIRIPPHGYLDWDKCKDKEQDDTKLLASVFLLGLDTELVNNKIEIRDKINTLAKNRSLIKNEGDIKEIISNGVDVDVSISALKSDIESLENSISKFKISEEYNEIIADLEELKYNKHKLNNKINMIEKKIKSINESLNVKVDISSDKVIKLYKEASVILPSLVKKELKEVSDFHEKILIKRQVRLKEEKVKLLSQLEDSKNILNKINNEINQNTKYINNTGSISEFESLQHKLTNMKLKLQKIEEYNRLLEGITNKINALSIEFVTQTARSEEYITENKLYIDSLSKIFKSYIDYIYEEKKEAGISITNNTGKNKLRFNIQPMVSGEGSQGINKVKNFCMDFLNLTLQKNHNIKFIYHDNSMFSETDPRQVYKMIKLAIDLCGEEYQYIFNINDDMFNNIVDVANEYDDKDFIEYLNSRVVIELLDDSDENKLLGYHIHMKL